jgi:hypothetical protein
MGAFLLSMADTMTVLALAVPHRFYFPFDGFRSFLFLLPLLALRDILKSFHFLAGVAAGLFGKYTHQQQHKLSRPRHPLVTMLAIVVTVLMF